MTSGCCEHGGEPSGFIRDAEFVDFIIDYQLLKTCFFPQSYFLLSPWRLDRTKKLVSLSAPPHQKIRFFYYKVVNINPLLAISYTEPVESSRFVSRLSILKPVS